MQLYCSKWFSAGTFQSSYFSQAITIQTTRSIRQAHELILLCLGKASNVQDLKKEYTKIYISERAKRTIHTLKKHSKTFSFEKIQHNIQ